MSHAENDQEGKLPNVLWGQSKDTVYLTVKVQNCKEETVDIGTDYITFSAFGTNSANSANSFSGQSDQQQEQRFRFHIKLMRPIIVSQSNWSKKRLTGGGNSDAIQIRLKKAPTVQEKMAWPRISEERLSWIKTDFDHFYDDDAEEDNESANDDDEADRSKKAASKSAIYEKYPNAMSFDSPEFQKMQDQATHFMKTIKSPLQIYLILFNLVMFAGNLYIFCVTLYSVLRYGTKTAVSAEFALYSRVRDQLRVVQALAMLEPLHTAMRWTSSSLSASLMQCGGRALVVFLILEPHSALHSGNPALAHLLLAWSCIELVRYPHYVLRSLFRESPALLTYLRYTLWIPLYPLGFVSEGRLILAAIPLLLESGRFSLALPNRANLAFSLPHALLYVYLPGMMLAFYLLMQVMLAQRRRVLGPGKSEFTTIGWLRQMVRKSMGLPPTNKNNLDALSHSGFVKKNALPNSSAALAGAARRRDDNKQE